MFIKCYVYNRKKYAEKPHLEKHYKIFCHIFNKKDKKLLKS